MIRAIAFDMDQTLVNLDPVHEHATRQLYAQRALAYRPLDDEAAYQGWRVVDYLARLNQRDGLGAPAHELVRERAHHFRQALPTCNIDLLPGAREILPHLAATHPLALVTGTDHACAHAVLTHYEIHTHFRLIVTGEDTPTGKPDPAPYLHAAKHLNVHPTELLVIEDSEAGVQSARAAGARVIAIPCPTARTPHDLSLAHAHATTLHEVPHLITRLNDKPPPQNA